MLAGKAHLFEDGDPKLAADDEAFIKRLNYHVSMRMQPLAEKAPDSLAATITAKGTLNKHAELILFGRWLLIDGMPGCRTRRGKQLDASALLKVVACAFAAQQWHALDPKYTRNPEAGTPFKLTSKKLVDQRGRLFGDQAQTRDYQAALPSLAYILPEYLEHLKTGDLIWDGIVVQKSAKMTELRRAMKRTRRSASRASLKAMTPAMAFGATSMAPAPLHTDFEIELLYSSPDQELQ